MNKIVITVLVVWGCSATVMAVKHRFDTVPQSEIPDLKSEIKNLRADHSRLTWELAAVKAKQVTENSSQQVAKRGATSQEKEANKLLSKDVWKGLGLSYQQSQDKEVGKKYGPLAKQLGMDPERRELFLAVMSERGGPMQFMQLMRGGDADNKVLQKLFSADEYTAWQNYEKSMPVRESVQAFENNTGTELTEDQRERLVDIFQKNDYLSTRSVDVSDDESASRSIDRTYQALNPIMNEASAVLTPEQQQAMDRFLGEQVASQEQTAQANSTVAREARQTNENPVQGQGAGLISINGVVKPTQCVVTKQMIKDGTATHQLETVTIKLGEE